MTIRWFATCGLLTLALSGPALAQSAPEAPAETAAAPAAPATAGSSSWLARRAAFALRGAYRAIADAEVRGASPYLDAARTHYRNALARYERQDAGASGEAMAALALARAAVADHPVAVPRDLPTPPPITGGGMMMRRPEMMGRGPGGPGAPQGGPMRGGAGGPGGPGERGRPMRGGFGGAHGFDATRLANDVKLAGTSEAKDLGQKALDADIARTRAAFSGNQDEAMRQGRLASSLAMAVRSLAFAEHPPAVNRGGGRPGARGGWIHETSGQTGGTSTNG